MTRPKFSVVVGFYNQSSTLPMLLESLSKQTFQDFEIIVCDDVSSEDIKPLIGHSVTARGISIKHIRPKKKQWLAGMMNMGIEQSQGDYILFVMADSFLETNYMELLDERMDEDTIICGVRIQVENGKAVDVDYRLTKGMIPQEDVVVMNNPWSSLTGNGLCIPYKALEQYGGWDKDIKGYGGDDAILIGKMFFHGLMCRSCPDLVLYHNWHKGTMTGDKNKEIVAKKLTEYAYGK
jgi:GT2 family glycosyltransferase